MITTGFACLKNGSNSSNDGLWMVGTTALPLRITVTWQQRAACTLSRNFLISMLFLACVRLQQHSPRFRVNKPKKKQAQFRLSVRSLLISIMHCIAMVLLACWCLISTNAWSMLSVLTSASLSSTPGLRVPSSLLCFGENKVVGLLEHSDVTAASDVSFKTHANSNIV